MYQRTIFLILLAVAMLPSYSAEAVEPVYDTLKLLEGSRIIIGGNTIKFKRDTTIIIHSQLDYTVKYPRGMEGDIFFDSLENRANKSRWTQSLHNIMVREPQTLAPEDTFHTRLSTEAFLPHAGKTIRRIRYTKLKPFGPTIYDTTRISNSKLEKFGNNLHRVTLDRVIHNHLLFREGDFVDPNKFADNERIIRTLPFIEDVIIHLIETSPGSDSVDILVLTKDAFSIGAGGAIDNVNAGRLELFEKNLFGMGHQLHTIFHWDAARSDWMGNELFYIINNMGGTFINSKLRYASVFETETYEMILDRRFFTPEIKWAGGLELERTKTITAVAVQDTLYGPFPLKYNLAEGWVGRSFHLGRQQSLSSTRLNFVLATRVYREKYIERPEVSENIFYDFQHKTGWLTSFSITSQSFYKSNLILDFGRTEDIPQGMLLNFTIGPEIGEFSNRLYGSLSLSQGRYLRNVGYLYTIIEAGGFLRRQNFIEQGVFNMRGDYFTNLFIVNRFKFRHFFSATYNRGIRRFEDEYVKLTGENGIRGFRSDLVQGTHKLVFNYEVDAFTPYYLYGFRFVMFGFADIGMLGPDVAPVHDGRFYSGLGLGVRIRNERLVFETITIRLGYYPNHPEESFPLFLDVYGEQRLDPDDFYVTKPDIIRHE